MRLLVLCPDYWPRENPRAQRWTAISRAWARSGWEVHLLCARNGCARGTETLAHVRVHRVGYRSLGAFLERPTGAGAAGPRPVGRGWANRLNSLTWHRLYWPDGACLWYPDARRKAFSLLAAHRYDALVSVSVPFTAHWVAYAVRKAFPGLPWLVDIGDPFSFLHEAPKNNLRLYRRKNIRAERAVLRKADGIVLTNEGARKAYAAHFPDAAGKLRVIPPVWIPPSTLAAEGSTPSPLPAVLSYFGSFYSGLREPGLLLGFLDGFFQDRPLWRDSLRVQLYGPLEDNFRKQLQNSRWWGGPLIHRGWLPRAEAWHKMRAAPFLLSLGNRTAHQLPSKAADYWMSRRPVVHLQQHPEDAFSRLFRNYPAFLALDPQKVHAGPLIRFLNKVGGPVESHPAWKDQARAFSVDSVSQAYADLIRSIIQSQIPDRSSTSSQWSPTSPGVRKS